MTKNLIIIAVLALVLIGGVVILMGSKNSSTKDSMNASQIKGDDDDSIDDQEEEVDEDDDDDEEATDEAAMEESVSISISNFAFSPKTIKVKKGTKVTWTNQDTVKHNAVADDGSFETDLMAKGESESETFEKAGTFTYHCLPHPNMKATIIVE